MEENNAPPRPLFLYGTLCALPLLAWVLTGDHTGTDIVRSITRPAYVKGYARYTVRGKDYPAAIKHDDNDSRIDGLLLFPQNHSQRTMLDNFEGEAYCVTPVLASVIERGEQVDADMYIWNGDQEDVSKEHWDLETFIRERLDDWLEMFAGMQLVG